ncbi:MAG: YraN family protein [bacterium]
MTRETGNLGEDLAVKFLKKNRYKILEQNKENHLGEIDILARTPGILKNDIVIVEVKTKSTKSFGEGFEMVNYFKKNKLLSLARELQKEYPSKTIRIDIISVDLSGKKPEIKHFVNAVEDN